MKALTRLGEHKLALHHLQRTRLMVLKVRGGDNSDSKHGGVTYVRQAMVVMAQITHEIINNHREWL